MTEEKAKKLKYGKSIWVNYLIFCNVIFYYDCLTIHQFGALGMINWTRFIATGNHPMQHLWLIMVILFTFKHGALHGFLWFSLFEQKSWKYILVTGYGFIYQ